MSQKESASATVVPLRRRGCPQCSKPMVAQWRPFCSKRCADLDLGRWLSETYRFAGDEEPATGEHDDTNR